MKQILKFLDKYVVLLFLILVFILGSILFYFQIPAIKDNIIHSTISPNNGEEIERKWLISPENIPIDLGKVDDVSEITQTYINYSPEIRVRKITDKKGDFYTMGIKVNLRENGLVRDENEYYLTKEEYETLFKKGQDYTIQKTRYQFLDENGLTMAVDIFHDKLEGLAYLEIEFDSKEEANNYVAPIWVIRDLTDGIRYKNGSLAQFGIPKE